MYKRPKFSVSTQSLSLLLSEPVLFEASVSLSALASRRFIQVRVNHVLIYRRRQHVERGMLPLSVLAITAPTALSATAVQIASTRFNFKTQHSASSFFKIVKSRQAVAHTEPFHARYVITSTLGTGSSSTVYAATRSDGAQVALKTMSKETVLATRSKTSMLLAERHALLLAAKSQSPFLVRLEEASETDSSFVFVTERGVTDVSSIASLLHESPQGLRRVFAQMVLAVRDFHALGMKHGDVKLENFVVMPDGTVKVADFGLAEAATSVRSDDEASMRIRGTRRYMSPESLCGRGGKQADVWALGVCLFVLATGSWPFGGAKDALRLFREIRGMETPLEYVKGDERLKSLIGGMLRKHELDRFDVEEVMKHEWFEGFDWEGLVEDGIGQYGFEEVQDVLRQGGFKGVGKCAFEDTVSEVSSVEGGASSSAEEDGVGAQWKESMVGFSVRV
ncbi:CBL-interacting protein kinase 19 [Gracilariopsis chorda]|uniref:non-specific serine/threonine protein kinase n=1 Tax=Gracilariopsis chorda TaxID=448386 RepID=A0A2V3J5U8_9FLOR|nr:CBL-interacting protein kinase 19 [Gracilariopsis chorda]|eukprot:PXF49754.1 CBL-interacting protein kinase 19 [Gracilariopsis chorda]